MVSARITRAFLTVITALILFVVTVHLFVPTESRQELIDRLAKVAAKEDRTDQAAVKPKKEKDVILALLNDPVPRRDFLSYAKYPAQNIKDESGYAYATLLCTREPSLRDPFFAATQSLVWRLLWSDWHGSYPVIVFVCPFIPEEQRLILQGQGAIVREIGLLDKVVPEDKVPVARWIDQFSKLNMWKETDYKKIAYLDVDAFPVANIDDLFSVAEEQSCVPDLLTSSDRVLFKPKPGEESFCRYTFAGVDPYGHGEVNGGFLLFSPDMKMYERLLQNAAKIEEYDINKMEQGLLHSKLGFGQDGPFKAHLLPQVYNAVPDYYKGHRDDNETAPEGPIRVIHDKLWSTMAEHDRPELNTMWDLDWLKLCRFYDGDVFTYARETGRLKSNLEVFLENASAAENDN